MVENQLSNLELNVYAQRPQTQTIEWIGEGDVNNVALVDDKELFRFPKNELGRGQLAYEFQLLSKLYGKISLAVPKPIYIDPKNSFSIFGYIPGKVVKDAYIRDMPTEVQEKLGEDLADFIIELNAGLSKEDVLTAQSLRPGFESWDDWYQSMRNVANKNNSKYKSIYENFLEELGKALPNGFDGGNVVIHDDLHALNMIFTPEDKLTGIIDFGDLNIGDIHRELRPIYRIGDKILAALIDKLDSQFGTINVEAIRRWAITHEVAVLIEREDNGTLDGKRAKFANELLELWLGENWGEL